MSPYFLLCISPHAFLKVNVPETVFQSYQSYSVQTPQLSARNLGVWGLPWWSSGKASACRCRGPWVDFWSRKTVRATGQLSSQVTTTEPVDPEPRLYSKRSRRNEKLESSPYLPQLEKACWQQQTQNSPKNRTWCLTSCLSLCHRSHGLFASVTEDYLHSFDMLLFHIFVYLYKLFSLLEFSYPHPTFSNNSHSDNRYWVFQVVWITIFSGKISLALDDFSLCSHGPRAW